MSDEAEIPIADALARMERALNNLHEGLGLVGVKPCCWCQRFFRVSDHGAIFDAGEMVCYGCIHEWWPQRGSKIAMKDREVVEQRLVRWLLSHHGGKVIQRAGKLPGVEEEDLRIVAACDECAGSGMSMGGRCRFCEGRGTIWVIIPKSGLKS